MTEIPTGATAGKPTTRDASPSGDERGSAPASEQPPSRPLATERAGNGSEPDDGTAAAKPRRRGSRGGRNRSRPRPEGGSGGDTGDTDDRNPDLPEPPREGQPKSVETADASLVRRPAAEAARKPQIGDSMPAPTPSGPPAGRGGD